MKMSKKDYLKEVNKDVVGRTIKSVSSRKGVFVIELDDGTEIQAWTLAGQTHINRKGMTVV